MDEDDLCREGPPGILLILDARAADESGEGGPWMESLGALVDISLTD